MISDAFDVAKFLFSVHCLLLCFIQFPVYDFPWPVIYCPTLFPTFIMRFEPFLQIGGVANVDLVVFF